MCGLSHFVKKCFLKVLRNVSKYDVTYIQEDLRRKDFRFVIIISYKS